MVLVGSIVQVAGSILELVVGSTLVVLDSILVLGSIQALADSKDRDRSSSWKAS